MSRAFISILFLSFISFTLACGSTDNDANANKIGTGNVSVNSNNLPPGFSASPIPPSSNSTPGIPDPANANNVPKGATPTPGIPDPANIKKPLKPGATPTPGIPSPEELRKQLQRNANGSEVNRPATGSDTMMMKRNDRKDARPVNKP